MKCYFAAFLPEEDGGYSVLFPDVPGCQTCGDTLEEAFSMAVDALAGHLEALADDNDPIPEPSSFVGAREKLCALCGDCGICVPEDTPLQLVPAPELDSAPVRVSVSFRRYTLDMIDRRAEQAGMTRSGFLAAAASTYGVEERA